MARADYSIVQVTDSVVFISDDDAGGMSVTNDAEAVVGEVARNYLNRRIVYRDSTGQWDELLHRNGEFRGFGPFDPREW